MLDEMDLEAREPTTATAMATADATDAFEEVLPPHLEFILPFMLSRPIVLRPRMSRFNAAQCLDRIVA